MITRRTAIGITLIVLIGFTSWGLAGALEEQQYINYGKDEYNRGNYDAAIYLFNKAIKLNPNNEYLYNDLGLCYTALEEMDMAIPAFSKAIELNSDCVEAYYNRGLAYFEQGRNAAPDAISDFTKTIELEPDNVDAYYNRGLTYNMLYNRGTNYDEDDTTDYYTKAVADFDKVLVLDPAYVLAIAGKGNAAYRNKEYDKAEGYFAKALESESAILDKSGGLGLAGVYASRARNLKAMCDYNASIIYYEEVINYDPTLMTALLHQVSNYEYVGEYEKAIEWCDMAEEVMKNDPRKYENYSYEFYPYYSKGNIYCKLEQYEKALDMYDKADALCSEQHHSKPSIYAGRGNVYSALGEYDKAIENYNKTIELAGDKGTSAADAYKGLGIAYKELGENDKAREALEKAISLYDEYGEAGHGKEESIDECQKLLDEL